MSPASWSAPKPRRMWLSLLRRHLVARSLTLDGSRLRLVTVQTCAAWDEISRTGRLEADPLLAPPDFRDAYDWMERAFAERTGLTGAGLLWAWARIRPTDLWRQLRHARREEPPCVLIEFTAGADQVLLSGFDLWHDVLNRIPSYPLCAGESADEWWQRTELRVDDFLERARPWDKVPLTGWPEALRSELEESWSTIFEPRQWRDGAVQAVTRDLRLADVVSVRRV